MMKHREICMLIGVKLSEEIIRIMLNNLIFTSFILLISYIVISSLIIALGLIITLIIEKFVKWKE